MSTQTRRYPDALGAYVRLVTGRRTKWAVVAFGIVLAGLLVPLGGKLAPLEKNSSASFLPAGAPSTEVAAYQAAHGAPSPLPALVVFARTGGLGPSDRAAIEGAREAVGALHLPGASQPGPVRWSPTGRAATFEVPITAATPTTTVVDDVKTVRSVVGQRAAAASGRAAAASGRAAAGLEVAVGGPAGSAADASNAFAGVNGRLLAVTGAIVAVLLLLIYRSPLLWLVPLASVGLAAGWAQGAAYGLAKAGFTINGMVVGIMSVLVFGAGTDYALLLVARYREELRRRHDHHEAVAVALRRAAPAIVTSGVTVVLALLCLLVAQLSDIAALGPACAVGIVCALFAQLAFLPALLAVVGRRAFWPFVPRGTEHRSSRPAGLWARLGEGLVRHPRPVWLGLTVALAACSAGLLAYQGGVNQDNGFRTQVGSVTAQKLLSADFPGHGPAPAVVLVRPPSALGAAMRVVKATPGTGALGRPRPLGRAVTWQGALQVARSMLAADGTPAQESGTSKFFNERAEQSLAPLLHAAALSDGEFDLGDVHRWVRRKDWSQPEALLSGEPLEALENLTVGSKESLGDTLGKIGTILRAYEDPTVRRNTAEAIWSPAEMLEGADTLYVVYGPDAARLAPVYTALIDEVIDAARRKALRDGPMDPPLWLLLDEAGTGLALADLPATLARSRGEGIRFLTAWQDLGQLRKQYGDEGRSGILGNSAAQVWWPPDDGDTARYLSDALGHQQVKQVSRSKSKGKGDTSESESIGSMAVLDAGEARTLAGPLLLYRGKPAAELETIPYYKDKLLKRRAGTVMSEGVVANVDEVESEVESEPESEAITL